MAVKYFTREEAEALLPRVEPLLEELQRLRAIFLEHETSLSAFQEKVMGNGHLPPAEVVQEREAITETAERMDEILAEINTLGILVKDLDMGLIDFPTLRHGREVYLCWRLGEEGIGWWHPTDSGFSGRQPIETF